jgi:beta-aspartyl-peptidase (threonine type)
MPIPACYSPALETIVEDADAVSAASIYSIGRHAESESAVRAVLDAQVVAWNKGDIDGFMRGYWMSKDLTFFSGGSETHGWTETLDRYRKSYKGTGKQMGQLTFGDLRIEMLSPDAAFVRGTWKLTMPSDPKTPHGLFTLIFRKTPDGWRIIHDSTGAA